MFLEPQIGILEYVTGVMMLKNPSSHELITI